MAGTIEATQVAVEKFVKSDGVTPWDFYSESLVPTTPPAGVEGSTTFVGPMAYDSQYSLLYWDGTKYAYARGLTLQSYFYTQAGVVTVQRTAPQLMDSVTFTPRSASSRLMFSIRMQVSAGGSPGLDNSNPRMDVILKKDGVQVAKGAARPGDNVVGPWNTTITVLHSEVSDGTPHLWSVEAQTNASTTMDLVSQRLDFVVKEVTI